MTNMIKNKVESYIYLSAQEYKLNESKARKVEIATERTEISFNIDEKYGVEYSEITHEFEMASMTIKISVCLVHIWLRNRRIEPYSICLSMNKMELNVSKLEQKS